jgi:Tfp pilus assembly protein PilO
MAIDISKGASKEQLQKVAIVVVAGVVLLGLLYYFVVVPMQNERVRLERGIANEQQVLDDNRSYLQQQKAINAVYEETATQLRKAMTEQLAPAENPVSWISSIIQDVASRHRVLVRSISGAGTIRPARTSRDAPPPLFEVFQVQVELRAGYHEFGRFLADLEKRIPYARLDTLAMQAATESGSGEQELQVVMRYAIFRFTDEGFSPSRRPPVLKQESSSSGTEN